MSSIDNGLLLLVGFDPVDLASQREGIPSSDFKISSLTTRRGLHSSRALKTDCWQPGSGRQTHSQHHTYESE
eukprot:4901057-Amphidinium_carterae.1